MNRTLTLFAMVTAISASATAPLRADVSLQSLLKEMVSFDDVARWPKPEYTCKQASSYDRGSVAPDKPGWFANSHQNQFIRDEQHAGRKERVMMDADGPGCVVRFWLTTDQNKQGTLRVYLDGMDKPALVFPSFDLLNGPLQIGEPLAQPHPGYMPDGGGGNSLYLPIPYAKHCKVTWEEASNGSRYYQINYRTYAPGTPVKTFTLDDFSAAKSQVLEANRILAAPDYLGSRGVHALTKIPAHGELPLRLLSGPHAVSRLESTVPPALSERQLRSLIVEMSCDGEDTIWCPVTDFFGSGVGLNPVKSWYRTVTTNGILVSRWIMPWRNKAKLVLHNLGAEPTEVSLQAVVAPWQWDDRSLYFHAAWHHEAGLQAPPPRDWNFITIKGRGVYVGDTLAIFNPVPAWYGEGDEKIWVDGEKFPSHFGTGTEDYYGYSYAPKPVHQSPFCGEPRIDQPQTQGHNTSIRSRNLDGIPFRASLQFDMEIIPWRKGALSYAATTYWYAAPGATSNRNPQPDAATSPVPTLADAIAANEPKHFQGAIECEKLKIRTKSGDFSVREQDMEPFGGERWSGGAQLLAVPRAVGDIIEIEIPTADNAPRHWFLHATQARDYGQLRFSIDGEDTGVVLDGYAPEVQPAQVVDLGTHIPHGKVSTLKVQVTGCNSASSGGKYLLGLDCLVLKKP